MEDTGGKKEQTIRGLMAECQGRQRRIRQEMEKSFDRQQAAEAKNIAVPTALRPNILDEIMDELKALNNAQQKTIEFIVTCINPKL